MRSTTPVFPKAPIIDEEIEKYEFHEYEPVARTNLNSAGEIRINVEQDLFIQPNVRRKINKKQMVLHMLMPMPLQSQIMDWCTYLVKFHTNYQIKI